MTRQEILDMYDVNERGIITSPGKFEAESLYAPHFYEASLDGSADTLSWPDGSTTYVVDVDDEDRAQFPEIGADVVVATVNESDQGFVSVYLQTRSGLRAIEADCENAWEEEEEEEEGEQEEGED